jgi:hypothetical protein
MWKITESVLPSRLTPGSLLRMSELWATVRSRAWPSAIALISMVPARSMVFMVPLSFLIVGVVGSKGAPADL